MIPEEWADISTRKGTKFLQLLRLAAFPGAVLLGNSFAHLIAGLLHPIRSVAPEAVSAEKKPVLYEENVLEKA
jgi:hypothetical protein